MVKIHEDLKPLIREAETLMRDDDILILITNSNLYFICDCISGQRIGMSKEKAERLAGYLSVMT